MQNWEDHLRRENLPGKMNSIQKNPPRRHQMLLNPNIPPWLPVVMQRKLFQMSQKPQDRKGRWKLCTLEMKRNQITRGRKEVKFPFKQILLYGGVRGCLQGSMKLNSKTQAILLKGRRPRLQQRWYKLIVHLMVRK